MKAAVDVLAFKSELPGKESSRNERVVIGVPAVVGVDWGAPVVKGVALVEPFLPPQAEIKSREKTAIPIAESVFFRVIRVSIFVKLVFTQIPPLNHPL